MAFKMKGPSLLKMVAELKKSPTKKSFKPETMKKTSGGKSGSLSDVVTNIKGKAIKALDKIEKKAIKGMEKPVEQVSQRASKTSTLIPGIAQAVGVSLGPLSVGAAANIAKNLLKNTKSTKTKAFGKKALPTKKNGGKDILEKQKLHGIYVPTPKITIKPLSVKKPVLSKNLPEDVTKMPKKKIKPLPVSTDVKLKK